MNLRRWTLAALAALLVGAALVGVAGEVLSRPVHRAVGPIPAGLAADPVEIRYAGDAHVSGWSMRGKAGAGAILLLHGVRSDRLQMVERARFLHARGYSVLLIDLPAHGESSGDRITFGAREAMGVKAALSYLERELPDEPIGVIGVSLGAASFVLSGPDPRVRAVVLESMYPTIEDAVGDRLRHYLGAPGGWLAPLLIWQLPLRTGVSPRQLRPIERIGGINAPVFVISGTRDWHTTPGEARRLFEAAAQPRQLWLVDGAAHVDLHAFGPRVYEERVGAFLASHLIPRPAP